MAAETYEEIAAHKSYQLDQLEAMVGIFVWRTKLIGEGATSANPALREFIAKWELYVEENP